VDHLEERLCGHEDVGESAVTLSRDIQIQPMSDDIEAMAEFMRKECLTQAHRAEAFGEIDVAPAAFFFDREKTHIEWCVVCDENGALCKLQELWQYGVDGCRVRNIVVADLMNLFRFPGDWLFRIHKMHKWHIISNDAVLDAHPCDLNNLFALQRIEAGRFEIEDREGGQRSHGHGL